MRTILTQKRLTVSLVGLVLLPFVVLCFYSHPALDDFSDAVQRHDNTFWGMQESLYLYQTGRLFTSVLLTDFSPLTWGLLDFYWVAPLLTLGLLLASLYAVLRAVVGQAWPAATCWLAAGVLLALWLVQNPSVAESVYWYNGLAVYSIPTALLLFWVSSLVHYWQATIPARRAQWLALNVVLGSCVLWSNEIIALPLLASTTSLGLWEWQRRGPRRLALVGLVAWFGLALAISFLAPGNMMRAHLIQVSVPLPWVVVGSATSSAYMLLNWLSSGVLVSATVLALPTLMRLWAAQPPALRRLATLKPVHVGVAVAAILLMLPLAALPSYWATGGLMPPRARASIYMLFVVGWFAAVLVAIAVAHNRAWLAGLRSQAAWPRPVAGLLWAWLFLNLATDHNMRLAHRDLGRASNTAVLAYRDWLSGRAARYSAFLRARYAQLRATPAQRVQVAALPWSASPQSLLYYDITSDSTYACNRDYAQYFDKKTIWTGPGGQGLPPRFYQPAPGDE